MKKICELFIQPLFDEIIVSTECIMVNFGCGINCVGTQKTYVSEKLEMGRLIMRFSKLSC
jgi:hypothetical protein